MKKRRPMGYWNQPVAQLAKRYPASDANSANGYIRVSRNNKIVYLHRLIWEELVGPIPPDKQVDHINRVKTDNRLSNLRLVSIKENRRNMSKRSDNSTGVTGVSFWESGNAYRAVVGEYPSGSAKFRTFSVKKHGEQKAFELACQAREEAMKALSKTEGFTHDHGK